MAHSLTIAKGQAIRFPVAATHLLAKYQQLVPLSSVTDIHTIPLAEKILEKNPSLSDAAVVSHLNAILGNRPILHFKLPDFWDLTVEDGATLVFSGPITSLWAVNVRIYGTLIAYGSLTLNCATIGG